MQSPPPAVFHDKYQWEIWKNTAGKSAISNPEFFHVCVPVFLHFHISFQRLSHFPSYPCLHDPIHQRIMFFLWKQFCIFIIQYFQYWEDIKFPNFSQFAWSDPSEERLPCNPPLPLHPQRWQQWWWWWWSMMVVNDGQWWAMMVGYDGGQWWTAWKWCTFLNIDKGRTDQRDLVF